MDLTRDDFTRDEWKLLRTMKKIGHRVNPDHLREKTGLSQKRFDRAWLDLQAVNAVWVNRAHNCALGEVGKEALRILRRGWLRPLLREVPSHLVAASVGAVVTLLVQHLLGR